MLYLKYSSMKYLSDNLKIFLNYANNKRNILKLKASSPDIFCKPLLSYCLILFYPENKHSGAAHGKITLIKTETSLNDICSIRFIPLMLLVLLHKKWSFPLGISSVNVTKSAICCRFDHHIYWRVPKWKTSFFVQCLKHIRHKDSCALIW